MCVDRNVAQTCCCVYAGVCMDGKVLVLCLLFFSSKILKCMYNFTCIDYRCLVCTLTKKPITHAIHMQDYLRPLASNWSNALRRGSSNIISRENEARTRYAYKARVLAYPTSIEEDAALLQETTHIAKEGSETHENGSNVKQSGWDEFDHVTHVLWQRVWHLRCSWGSARNYCCSKQPCM